MRHSLLAAAKYRPTLTKTEKSNRTNQVSWRTHERIAPLTRSSPCGRQKTMTLKAGEFIRRFLIHVLPDGFHRIRYYGFLGNRHRAGKLTRCRELLGMSSPGSGDDPPADYRDRFEALTGRSLRECPRCHTGTMVVIDCIARQPMTCQPVPDTS